jgi:DNA-binding XRE family transcriptional regulator
VISTGHRLAGTISSRLGVRNGRDLAVGVAGAGPLAVSALLHYDPHAGGRPSLPALSLRGGLMSFPLSTIVTGGNMSPKRLATVLRTLRNRHDMTQEDLANRAKVARSYVALIESGRKKNPSLEILKRLARALGVPVTELLE